MVSSNIRSRSKLRSEGPRSPVEAFSKPKPLQREVFGLVDVNGFKDVAVSSNTLNIQVPLERGLRVPETELCHSRSSKIFHNRKIAKGT